MRAGCKLWGLLRPIGYEKAKTRDELTESIKANFAPEDGESLATACEQFVIDARPGDIMCVNDTSTSIESRTDNAFAQHPPSGHMA